MLSASAEREALQSYPFPPVVGVAELAFLLRKTPGVILADRSRAPHRIPPSCEPPGSKQPLWLLDDVLAWLRQYQRPAASPPVAASTQAPTPRRRGRPTKREQIERARAAGGAA